MTDSQQDSDGTPTGHASVSVAEAARRLGVTPDAIRSRLHRGTLEGEKVDNAWQVRLPDSEIPHRADPEPTDSRQDATGQETGTDGDRQDSDRIPTVDLTPLTALIERLSRQNADLSAATAGWQARALQAEERLLQLAATVERDDDAPGSSERNDAHDQDVGQDGDDSAGVWERLRRFLIG